MADIKTPNLPGANELFNTIVKKVEEIDTTALEKMASDASEVVSQLKTDLSEIKEHPPTQQEYMPRFVEKLKECYDPEISVDIYNLGLIYDVKVTEDGYVHVLMSLTSAFCPAADMIPKDVQQKIESIPNLKCKVKITMQPQWGRDMINPEVKNLMGL